MKVHIFGYVDKEFELNFINQFNSLWNIPRTDPVLQHGTGTYVSPQADSTPLHSSKAPETPLHTSLPTQLPQWQAPKAKIADGTELDMSDDSISAIGKNQFGKDLQVPFDSLPLDAQIAEVPNTGQSMQNLERVAGTKPPLENAKMSSKDTASIEQEEDVAPPSLPNPFEKVADSASAVLDDMPAILNAKARTGDYVFPETQLQDLQDTHEDSPINPKYNRDHEDDASSVVSTYAASVFSLPSLASSATDLAKDSGYSVDDIVTATEELLAIFQEDVDLALLYRSAIKDPSIGPQRLERNLRRIFKQYAEHLKSEAKDQLEFLASRLVSFKAGFLSQSIVQSYDGSAAKPRLEKPHEAAVEENPDHEWDGEVVVDEEANFEDAVFGDLIAFREFLLGSSAFQTLRSRIQNFVLPKPSRRTGREVAVDGDVMEVHLELDDTRCGGIKTARILGSIMRTFDALLIATGHLEPPLEPAMVRLRWKCVSLHNALHTHRSLHDLTVNRGAEKTLQVT